VAGQVSATDRIEAVADRVEAAELPYAVVDGEGRVIGSLDRRAVVDTLIGRERPSGERPR
jgi:glycine betaine/proline transport system ATP-binding protein